MRGVAGLLDLPCDRRSAWFARLAKPTEDEEDMLDLAFGLEKTSRLGCQIVMTEALDGLVVRLPAAAGTCWP